MDAPTSSGPSAGGRRFWLTVFLFALANIAIWIGYHLWTTTGAPRRDILTMQRFTPSLEAASHRPPLTWTFNLDVGRAGAVEKAPGTIQPAINGVWLWESPRTLAFQPAEPLPMATKYTATLIPAMLTTSEGYTLPAPVTSTFSTTSLDMTGVRQAGFDDDGRMLLELTFNDKVIPAEVASHALLTDDNGAVIRAAVNGQAAGTTVRLLTDPIRFKDVTKDHTLSLVITKGLAGASGPLGIEQDRHWEVTVSSSLAADQLEASMPTDSYPELTIVFNNSIDDATLELIKPLLSVEPKVTFTARKNYRNGIVLSGQFASATRYTVTIAKTQVGILRGLRQGATLSVFVPDREPAAYFENTTGYLGSAGNRTMLVKAVNVPALRVTASRVYENNLVAWRNARNKNVYPLVSSDNYSKPVASRRYVLPVQKNVYQDVRISLDDLLGKDQAGDGTYRLMVSTDASADGAVGDDPDDGHRDGKSGTALVTLSDIGLTSKLMADPTTTGTEQAVLAWAVSLSTGKPMPGIHIRVYSDKNQMLGEGLTGPDGLARVEHLNPSEGEAIGVLVAQNEQKALTWLDLTQSQRNDHVSASSGRAYLRGGYEAFVYTERGVYRPGELVTVRAIVRGKDLSVPPAGLPLKFQIRRPDGRDWVSQSVQLDADGACEWKVPFENDAQTGYWSAQLGLPGDGTTAMRVFGNVDFQMEEFVPDRIKTALTLSVTRLQLDEKPLLVDVQSDYLFGQPAANLSAQLSASVTPAVFAAKDFGASDGWFAGDTADAASVLGDKRPTYDRIALPALTLDKNGHTQFAVDLEKRISPEGESAYTFRGPWHVSLTGSTVEMGGRAVTAYAGAEVDDLPYYVMVRATGAAQGGYVGMNGAASYEVKLVTPEGKVTDGDGPVLTATVFEEKWETILTRSEGHYQYSSTRTLTPVKTATDAAVSLAEGFSWKPSGAGSYVIQFADASTHQITTTRLDVGEEGGWNATVDRQNPEGLEVKLVAADGSKAKDGEVPTFRSGQAIKALVRSPFAGELLLTVETDGVLFSKVVAMDANAAEVKLDLPATAWPNGYVSATVIRSIDANKAWQTHRAFGLARFDVDQADRRLGVKMEVPTEMRPQTPMDVQLTLTTPDGQPARNAAVALAAVDEGILRLTGFETPSPLAYFGASRALGIDTADLYDELMPEVAKPESQSATGGGGEGDEKGFVRRHSTPVSAKRIRPVALVSEIVHTDEMGRAVVHVQVPEFLGQLRVMAVSYAGPLMGSGEKTVLVRSPLVVQSSFPRFLAPGDRCETSFLLINNTHAAGTAHLQLTTDAAVAFDRAGIDVALQPDEQKTVTVNLAAQQVAGVGHISVEATLSEARYSEHMELPIRPASPAITRGGMIRVTPGNDVTVSPPTDLLAGTDSLQVRVAPQAALNMPQGLDYLDRYPYGCLEQTTSEAFPLVYLHDMGSQISPNLFEPERMNRKIQTAIQRMMSMQTASGGLSMWPGETNEWTWGTVYAAHFLIEAEHAGYSVPADFKAHTLGYLRTMLTKSAEVGEETDVHAYALYVLALDGHPDRAAMNRLGEVLDTYAVGSTPPAGLEQARFHLALAWAAAGRTDLAEKLVPDTLPLMSSKRTLAGNISSPISDQSLILLTLLNVEPEHPQLPVLAERLAAAGQSNQWVSTQDNALAVMALGKYLHMSKDKKPFESATLTDGGKVIATASGKPLLWSGTGRRLAVHVSGGADASGFVSWLESGVPVAPPANADHTLKVRRTFLTEDGKPLGNNVATGTAIKVQITINSAAALDNLVVEDLLPAGMEIENPRLATSNKQDETSTAGATLSPSRLEVRDDRLVAVGSVEPGVTSYTYLARAVTVGDYVLPPIRGECMYDPGINSLNGAGEFHVTSEKKVLAAR